MARAVAIAVTAMEIAGYALIGFILGVLAAYHWGGHEPGSAMHWVYGGVGVVIYLSFYAVQRTRKQAKSGDTLKDS